MSSVYRCDFLSDCHETSHVFSMINVLSEFVVEVTVIINRNFGIISLQTLFLM